MYKELIEIRDRIDNLIEGYTSEREFKKVGEIYGDKGKYALYLSPKETETSLNWYKAVEYCRFLGDDLPTLGELQYLYDNYKEEFQHTFYWSSSQNSATLSWGMHFYYGNRDQDNKTYNGRVRAVRRVSL